MRRTKKLEAIQKLRALRCDREKAKVAHAAAQLAQSQAKLDTIKQNIAELEHSLTEINSQLFTSEADDLNIYDIMSPRISEIYFKNQILVAQNELYIQEVHHSDKKYRYDMVNGALMQATKKKIVAEKLVEGSKQKDMRVREARQERETAETGEGKRSTAPTGGGQRTRRRT